MMRLLSILTRLRSIVSARAGAFVLLLALAIAAAGSAATAANVAGRKPMTIDVDQAELVQLPEPATTVFVANPDIADVQVPNPSRFVVFGKKPGITTIYAMAGNGRVTSYTVTVRRPINDIAAALREQVPGAQVAVSSMPGGITISGNVASPRDAQRLKAVAHDFIGDKDDIVFNVSVAGSTQVNLRVRVAEVSRQIDKQFSFNWSALYNSGTIAVGLMTGRPPVNGFGNFLPSPNSPQPYSFGFGGKSAGGSVNVSSIIDALESEGIVTILAEPNLTASSGETASFLAGGEFPIPVAQANNTLTIEFKKFGVGVDFTPTVFDANRMSIKVRSEVSELSDAGAVTVDTIKIPGIAVRRAETTVDLSSGQSFAIAGLFQNNVSTQIQQFPWLGDIPVLGALFRSPTFQRKESELVIIVTPYIVQPATKVSDLHAPTDGLVFSNDIEQVLLGKLTATRGRAAVTSAASAGAPHLHGSAGFMLEQ
jgi:pilus assembly protein CpaC